MRDSEECGGQNHFRAAPRLAEEEAVVFSAWDKHVIDRHARVSL